MDNFDNEYEPVRKYKKTHKKRELENVWVVVLFVVVLGVIALFAMSLGGTGLFKDRPVVTDETSEAPIDTVDGTEDTTEAVTERKQAEIPKFDYTTVEKTFEDVHKGDLLLINNDHEYVCEHNEKGELVRDGWKFYDIDKLTTAQKEDLGDFTGVSNPEKTLVSSMLLNYEGYTCKNKWRILRLDVNLRLNEMMRAFSEATNVVGATLNSTYRDWADQEKLYDQYYNETTGKSSAARPGCSDYHLGTSFSFYLTNEDGTIEDTFITRLAQGPKKWLEGNMANYGFITRYPAYSYSRTGYSIPDQLRYVGIEHATYIMENRICLEDYLDDLRETYIFESPLVVACADGWQYVVYFIPANEEGVTHVTVPVGVDYTITGNNVDGFVVSFRAAENIIVEAETTAEENDAVSL